MAWPTTSRQSRGYGKEHDQVRRKLMADPERMWCTECLKEGRYIPGTICDHVIPLSRGGKTGIEHQQMLCQRHSDEKTAREAGRDSDPMRGVDRDGRPTSADHPWNRQEG